MNIKAVISGAVTLSEATGTQAELAAQLHKWLEKRLKAKSTTLDTLRLIIRSNGELQFRQLFEILSESCRRTVAKNIDPNNKSLASLNAAGILDHVVALGSGRIVPATKPAKVKAQRGANAGKKGVASSRARGDLLANSKY